MKRIFVSEFVYNLSKLKIGVFLAFSAIALIVLQVGISVYNEEKAREPEFIDYELAKVNRYTNYVQYGIYGFERLQSPSPLFSFNYNSSALTKLHAHIDNGVKNYLFKPETGKAIFGKPTGAALDFSWFLLVIGGLLVTLWGFQVFGEKDLLEFLVHIESIQKIFIGVVFARILLLVMCLTSIFAIATILFLLNGITLDSNAIWGLLVSFLITFLTLTFLMVLSTACGTTKKEKKNLCGVLAGILFLFYTLFLPEILNIVFTKIGTTNIENLQAYQKKKLDILMEFEDFALKNARSSRYKSVEEKLNADKEMGEIWWNSKFKDIERLSLEMQKNIMVSSKILHFSYSLFPTTFYKSVSNEIGSKGYNAYVVFCIENQKIQKGFLRFYLDKRFYEKYRKVIPYLKRDKILFASKGTLPHYFGFGCAILLLNILCVLFISYFRLKKLLEVHGNKFKGLEVKARKGFNVFLTKYESLKDYIILSFLDKNEVIITESETVNIIYLPGVEKLPQGIERLIDCDFNGITDKWDKMLMFLSSALKRADIVITSWHLDTLSDTQIETIKKMIGEKVYMNVGFDVYTFINRSKNRHFWKGDRDVKAINPFN